MDTSKNTLYVLLAGIIGIVITLFNTTQKKLTTDGYVMNVYLYIILAILVASLAVVALDQYQILSIDDFNGMKSLAMVIVIFVVLIALMMIVKACSTSPHLMVRLYRRYGFYYITYL